MIPNVQVVAPEVAKAVTVQLCDEHDRELAMALAMRGMERHVRMTDEERQLMAELGQSDPLTIARVQLTMSAMQTFGAEILKICKGCPVCAFHSVVTVVADAMALQFTKGH